MTVSFKVAEQPSELKVYRKVLVLWFFYLNCSDVPYNYYESKFK